MRELDSHSAGLIVFIYFYLFNKETITLERVKTGVPGFDGLIQEGIPRGFNVLLVGQPGAGKTIFGLQYLVNGAMQGENGLYISLDSPNEMVKSQGRRFGWEIDRLEREGKLSFLRVPLDKPKINLFDIMREEVLSSGAKRLVFDSLVDFSINADQFVIPLSKDGGPVANDEDQSTIERYNRMKYSMLPSQDADKNTAFYKGGSERRITYLVINELSKLGTTNIIITDEKMEGEHFTVDGVSEYVCDGVIVTYNQLIGAKRERTLAVLKMRNTNNSPYIHDLIISKNGVWIKPAEEVYV